MGCVEFDRVMEGGPHTRGTRATRDARTLPPVVSSPLLRCLSPSTFFFSLSCRLSSPKEFSPSRNQKMLTSGHKDNCASVCLIE